MGIRRFNQFPEGSGSLSSDDIFLFMDSPSGSGVTKKISLSEISNSIGGGGGSLSIEQRYFDYVKGVALYGTGGLTAVTGINDDDEEYLIELPFSVTFLGQVYNEVWLNSNSYLTFLSMVDNSPAGYAIYWPQGPGNLGVPAIVAGATDRNITNYYYGSTNDGRFVIRYEGKAIHFTGDSNVTATRIWEMWFYESEPEKISLVVSDDMPQGGVWGMHDGTKWVDIYEQLPRLDQNADWDNLINSVDIYTKEPSNANTLKFIGQGVETYIEGNKAFVEVNPLQGMLNVDLDGDGNTIISSAGYGLTLKSTHADPITLASNGDVNITAKTRDNDSPGHGHDIYINAGSAVGAYNHGGNVSINAGNPSGVISINNNENVWNFNADGSTSFPNNRIYPGSGQHLDILTLATDTQYTQVWQNATSWEVYPEDDTTGPNAAWSWIRSELPSYDTPQVLVENRKGSDGISYRWTFDADGDLTIPGNITLPNNTTVATGTFDNGTGGNRGISLNCVVGYELNWQGGHLKNTLNNGENTYNILFDSAIEFPGSGIDNVEVNSTGITFSDGTTQTSANISSTNITNFNSSVSGLLPVTNIVAGSGMVVNNNSGTVTINSKLVSDPSGITGATTINNIVQISQTDYDNLPSYDPNTVYIINT